MTIEVAPIVEGHGDVQAVPILLRRIEPGLVVRAPVRVPKSKLVRPGSVVDADAVRRAASIAAANIADRFSGLLLFVLDADDDCAARLGPELTEATRSSGIQRRAAVVIACREFESWIVGGIQAFGVESPEAAGDPKGRIRAANGDRYSETVDQPRFASRIDVGVLSERAKSFARLCRIIREAMQPASDETHG